MSHGRGVFWSTTKSLLRVLFWGRFSHIWYSLQWQSETPPRNKCKNFRIFLAYGIVLCPSGLFDPRVVHNEFSHSGRIQNRKFHEDYKDKTYMLNVIAHFGTVKSELRWSISIGSDFTWDTWLGARALSVILFDLLILNNTKVELSVHEIFQRIYKEGENIPYQAVATFA